MPTKPTKKTSTAETYKQQENAIKKAFKAFAKENGVDPKYLSIDFSNNIGVLDGSASSIEVLQPKGFRVTPSSHTGVDMEKMGAVIILMDKFVSDNPLEEFKTYKAFRNNVSAKTWEDVAAGMNEQFERLGSAARIDMSLFKSR